jgi:AcrR family transcriptional regulator
VKSETPRRYIQGARAQAVEATAERIVAAFLKYLMELWYDDITLAQVAKDAGVTVQTIVRRFGDKETLLAAAVAAFAREVNGRRECEPGDISEAVRVLSEDYELVGDMVIRLLALEVRYVAMAEVLKFGRAEHRAWVQRAFGPLLSENPEQAAVDALVLLTDVYTWKLLRRDLGRSVAEYRSLLVDLIGTQYGGAGR